MKTLVIVLSLLLAGQCLFTNSYAATIAWPTSDPSLPEIHMQVIIRNSDGILIAYFEPTLWYIADVGAIHALLDTKDTKILVHKDGKTYERVKFTDHFTMSETKQITSEPLYYNGLAVLHPRHDGVILQNGDTIDVHWNILRTIR